MKFRWVLADKIRRFYSSKLYSGVFILLLALILVLSMATIGFIIFDLSLALQSTSPIAFFYNSIYSLDSWGSSYSECLFMIFFFSGLISFIYKIFHGRMYAFKNEQVSEEYKESLSFAAKLVIFSVILSLVIFTLSYRYLHFPGAQGCDTPEYVYAINNLKYQSSLNTVIGTGRDVTIFIIIIFAQIFEQITFSFETAIMLIPLTLGVTYIISIYFFVKEGTNNEKKAIISAAIAPLSFFVIRLSYDLYSQLFGITLIFLSLLLYLKVLNGNKKFLMLAALVFTIALFSHMWTWMIFVSSLPFFIILSDSQRHIHSKIRSEILTTIKILIPSFAILALTFLMRTNIPQALTYTYDVGELHFFSLPSGWNWIASREAIYIWILSIVGLFSFSTKKDNFSLLMMSIVFTLSASAVILGYDQTYRILLCFPLPVIAGEGIYFLTKRCSISLSPRLSLIRTKQINFLLVFFAILLLFSSVLPRAYIPQYVYRPSDEGMQQLGWLQKTYGFGNRTVLILVEGSLDDPENRFRWTHAITGADVYKGDIFDLLNGRIFQIDQSHWLSYNYSQYAEVLIPGALYNVGSLEKSISNKIFDQDIYILRNTSIEEVERLTMTNALWLDDNLSQGWNLVSNQISHSFSINSGSFNISNIQGTAEQGWLTYEKTLASPLIGSRMTFRSIGNLTNLIASLEVYYADGSNDGILLTKLVNPTSSLYSFQLSPKTIDRIRIAITPLGAESFSNRYLTIDFLAVS
jgi:hypothetical protein